MTFTEVAFDAHEATLKLGPVDNWVKTHTNETARIRFNVIAIYQKQVRNIIKIAAIIIFMYNGNPKM